MVDTVEELVAHKENAIEQLNKVIAIEEDAKSETGLTSGLFGSYKKGFFDGLASISIALFDRFNK